MTPRLYLSQPLEEGIEVALADDDIHYLTRVRRLRPGMQLRCFDGSGGEWQATMDRSRGGSWQIAIGTRVRHDAFPGPALHLAQAWLKGQAMDRVVQKATELGVATIIPLQTQRTNVQIDATRTASRLSHWQRITRSAAEQCERLYLPTVEPPRILEDMLSRPPCSQMLFLDPGNPPIQPDLPREELLLLVGPEGGWTDLERSAAHQCEARFCGLGSLVLRAETAPLAAIAAIRQLWQWS